MIKHEPTKHKYEVWCVLFLPFLRNLKAITWKMKELYHFCGICKRQDTLEMASITAIVNTVNSQIISSPTEDLSSIQVRTVLLC